MNTIGTAQVEQSNVVKIQLQSMGTQTVAVTEGMTLRDIFSRLGLEISDKVVYHAGDQMVTGDSVIPAGSTVTAVRSGNNG